MVRKVTAILTGSESLNRKLIQLTSKQSKEAIRKAARPALQPTLNVARSLAPKRTGRLAKSIKIRAITRSRSRVGMRLTTSAKDNQYSGRTFYAAFQEFGWKTGRRKSASASRKQISGKEFMRRAALQTRSQAMKIYIHGIREYIARVTRR